MSVTVKAAWITAAAILMSALIATIANHYQPSKPHEPKESLQDDSLSSILIGIPAGSTVSIRIISEDKQNAEKVEAVIEKNVKEDSQLKLLRLPPISSIEREEIERALSGLVTGKQYGPADYFVLVDLDRGLSRVMDTRTGQVVFSQTIKKQSRNNLM